MVSEGERQVIALASHLHACPLDGAKWALFLALILVLLEDFPSSLGKSCLHVPIL